MGFHDYLSELIRKNANVRVFVHNGFRTEGKITALANEGFVLEHDGKKSLFFYGGVSTVEEL